MNQQEILNEIQSIDSQLSRIKYIVQLIKAYEAFKYRFMNVDNQQISIFRNHFGSYVACGMAIHNTYHLKQQIIKQCIYLTKSKNPTIIKLTSIPITSLYLCILTGLWHIPSFFGELALRTYGGMTSAVFTLLVDQEEILNDINLIKIIKEKK